jgi:hypothetical protein
LARASEATVVIWKDVMRMTRRIVLGGAAVAAVAHAGWVRAAEALHVAVTKGPGCECCEGWAKHLRDNGFTVAVTESTELNAFKARLGIPADLRTCHTGQLAGYLLEGHVPASAIRRLLSQKPAAIMGLAVPGMPVGSPGMEVEGAPPEEYSVIAFGSSYRKVWSRYRGTAEIT